MKRLKQRQITFVIFLILSFASTAKAQQSPIQVLVSPDHLNWQYTPGEEVEFTIQILLNNNPMPNAVINYTLGKEKFPNISKKDIILKNGTLKVKSTLEEPGFIQCNVSTVVEGKTYSGVAAAGYIPEKILPATKEPADFDSFWEKAITEARKIPLNTKMELLPDRCTETVNVYQVAFQIHKYGEWMYGILSIPKKEGKYPALLLVPGAGCRPYYGDRNTASKGVITLEVGIHGIPVNMQAEVYNNLLAGPLNNYMFINTNNPDSYYFKRVYLGCVKALDYLCSLPEYNGDDLLVTGGSQGGALSIVTAALDKRVKYIAAYHPALCDHEGYLENRAGGWPHYFYNKKPKEKEIETLRYFDVVNFARRVKAKGWYTWGYCDETCPPTSMYAAYNTITAPKELHLYQNSGHVRYNEQQIGATQWLLKQININY